MKSQFWHQFKTRAFKSGGYSTLISLLVIAVLVAVNLIVGEIPETYTKLDTTNTRLYSLSEQSQKIAKSIDKEVTIYLIAETGKENSALISFLERYAALNSNVKITYKDPLLYPNFVKEYTDDELSPNSLIIVGDKRSKAIDYSSIFISTYDYYYNPVWYFNGESEVTSALNYVTSARIPKVYVLGGHGERSFSEQIKDYIAKENIELVDFSLISMDAVPDDCDCLLILNPEQDLSSGEVSRIRQYLASGGRMAATIDYSGEEELPKPNLDSLLADYGVALAEGMVIEGNSNYHIGIPYFLKPTLSSHEITDPIADGNYYVLMPFARGITLLDTRRSSINIEKLLVTSGKSYAQVISSDQTSFEKKEGDIDGPFALAVAITEGEDDDQTRIVLFSSDYFINIEFLHYYELPYSGNLDLFINSLSWMVDKEESISIRAKDLTIEPLFVSEGASTRWTIVMCVLLPLACLAIGGIVWYRRRTR